MQIKNIINESLNISDDIIKQAVGRLDNDMDWSGGDGEHMVDIYAQENDIEDIDDVDIDDPEFKAWVTSSFRERVEDAIYTLENECDYDGERIVIWREIRAVKDFLSVIEKRGLGEYWSWDHNAAEAHWAGDGSPILMQSLASHDQIDWESTLAANASPTMSEEREITLKQGEKIPVEQLFFKEDDLSDWEAIDVSSIENKLFEV